MTRASAQQTASADRREPPGWPDESDPTVGLLLRTLADDKNLEVLRHLAEGEDDASTIAQELNTSESSVREFIAELGRAGLPAGASRRREAYSLANSAVALLNAALRYGADPNGTTRGQRVGVAPSGGVPLACTVCNNSEFVTGILGELRSALGEAREYHKRIQEMSSQVLTAHEAERLRIARELHDDTAQAITSMLVRLRLLERSATDPDVLKNVEELRGLTSEALDSVRRMAMDLRPAALDDLGLAPALESFADRFAQNWNIPVTVNVTGVKRRLPRDVELVLYRVLQEALTNVAKHAGAHEASVTLSRRNNQVTLTIADDGQGFGDETRSKRQNTGLGLFGMRERLALIGGMLEVDSRHGAGTTIVASVPLRAQKPQKGVRQ
jgi:signal transduction histidine kinase